MKIFKSYTELFCKIFIFHTVHLFIGIWTFWVLVSCVWVLVSCVQLFCDPVDCSLPGSSIHEISQARMLEWVVLSFSRGSSQSTSPAWQAAPLSPSLWTYLRIQLIFSFERVGPNSHLTLFERFWKSLESFFQILEPTEGKIENVFNY